MKLYKGLAFFLFLSFFSIYQYGQGSFSKIFTTSFNGQINTAFDDSTNNRVYVGGWFTPGGGKDYLMCLDRTTGTIISSFSPNITTAYGYYVTNILVYNNVVYFSGNFHQVGGQTRDYLAAVDATTGALLSWYPNVGGSITCFAQYNNSILIGGYFATVNGQSRTNFASLTTTGTLNTFSLNIVGSSVEDIAIKGSSMYLAGYFTTVSGQSRMGACKVNLGNGSLLSWNPNTNQSPSKIDIYNNRIYLLNNFTNVNGQLPKYYAVVDTTSGALVTNNYVLNPYNYDWQYYTSTSDMAVFADTTIIVADDQTNDNLRLYTTNALLTGNASQTSLITVATIPACISYNEFEFIKGNVNRLYSSYRCKGTVTQGQPGPRTFIAYCPVPKVPSAFSISTSTLCAGTKNVTYSIPPTHYVSSYVWTYSGTGVTITSNNNSATLDFSNSATSGTLSVQLMSNCDATVRKVSKYITVNPLPVLNAGPDITLNCANGKVGTLNGTVSTGGTTYAWNGPSSYYNNVLNPTLVNTPQGNYVLSSTITATGCSWRDTAYVTVDTITPSLTMPVLSSTKLTCANPSQNLNASTGTSGAVITWTNSNNTSHSNPWVVSISSPTVPTNYTTYSVTVMNPSNG